MEELTREHMADHAAVFREHEANLDAAQRGRVQATADRDRLQERLNQSLETIKKLKEQQTADRHSSGRPRHFRTATRSQPGDLCDTSRTSWHSSINCLQPQYHAGAMKKQPCKMCSHMLAPRPNREVRGVLCAAYANASSPDRRTTDTCMVGRSSHKTTFTDVSSALPNMFHISSCDFYVANLAQLQYREGFRICTCHDGIRLADHKACTFVWPLCQGPVLPLCPFGLACSASWGFRLGYCTTTSYPQIYMYLAWFTWTPMNLNKTESLCEIYIIIQQHPHFCSWSYDLSMDKVLQLNVSVHRDTICLGLRFVDFWCSMVGTDHFHCRSHSQRGGIGWNSGRVGAVDGCETLVIISVFQLGCFGQVFQHSLFTLNTVTLDIVTCSACAEYIYIYTYIWGVHPLAQFPSLRGCTSCCQLHEHVEFYIVQYLDLW